MPDMYKSSNIEARSLLGQTLSALSSDILELRQVIKNLKASITKSESMLRNLEIELDKCIIKSTLNDKELQKLKNEVEKLTKSPETLFKQADARVMKASGQNKEASQAIPANRPIMPGSGFSNITLEYLRSLKNK